jgi:hypothetical protein
MAPEVWVSRKAPDLLEEEVHVSCVTAFQVGIEEQILRLQLQAGFASGLNLSDPYEMAEANAVITLERILLALPRKPKVHVLNICDDPENLRAHQIIGANQLHLLQPCGK